MKYNKILLSVSTIALLGYNLSAKDIKFSTITVTAQKSEENIQDVPLSITAFDEFSLDDKNIKTIEDIALYTPNLYFIDSVRVGTPNPSIRGISSNTSFSTSAAIFIDGVPVTTMFGYKEILEDIERIEILKGPQGTLYGKDSHAGAINVITKQPTNETQAKIGIEFGSDNKKELSVSTSGAIMKDKFFIGLSARHYEKDGFIKNTQTNSIIDDRKNDFGKVNLRYLINNQAEISLISSILQQDDGTYKANIYNNVSRTIALNKDAYNQSKTTSHALKLNFDYNNYKFQSLTTLRKYKDKASCDTDFSPYTFFEIIKDGEYKKASQEFRLQKDEKNYKLITGLYFDKDTNQLDSNADMYDSTSNMIYYNYPYIRTKEEGRSIGLFGHLDYTLNDKFSYIVGIRYDKDKKSLIDSNTNTDLSNNYGALSPKFALEYKLNKDSMLYTTISKGYKSGGYYSYAPSDDLKQYDKETLISYEIGSKNILLDNKLILNTALYYMDISDMQIETRTALAQGYISNAAKATSKGFEFEANYKLNEEFTLTSALGYNITKLDEFKDSTGDYSGKYNPNAPKYNYNIGIKYRSADGYYASTDFSGYGKTYLSKNNQFSRDTFNLVNAKFGYEMDNFDIYVYGKNIFDKVYDSNGEQQGYLITYSEPREIGVQLAYRF